jgi:hypothetical protein
VKMMKNRNRIIIALLIIGTAMFGIVQFIVIPHSNEEKQKYTAAQLEPTTHDLSRILDYKSNYMGDASNFINLFHHLPLSDVNMDFQMFPNDYTAEVNYKNSIQNIGQEKVEKSLIYNSTAVFALIGNLKSIVYHFSGASYKVSRTDIEKLYDGIGNILEEPNWKNKVQSKLNDHEYVLQTAKKVLIMQHN